MKGSKITIENPCHMQWERLDRIKGSKNRHCKECAIDIVDFRNMSDEEIIAYLAFNKNQKVCCVMRNPTKSRGFYTIQRIGFFLQNKIRKELSDNLLRSSLLSLLSITFFAFGCQEPLGEPTPRCPGIFIPDTTTSEPNDSVYVEDCEGNYQ